MTNANPRSRTLLFLICLLLLSASPAFAGHFKVTRVYDGNTIVAEGCDIEIKVRLVGIDAPQISYSKFKKGQPYSQKAKKFLAELILDKTVDIRGYGLDSSNRVLGEITLGGKNINVEMIKNGYAEVYGGRLPENFDPTFYRYHEKQAREARRGMWKQGDYISPREWRRGGRKK
jgi:endonuclease YncB( thermonuclease family)